MTGIATNEQDQQGGYQISSGTILRTVDFNGRILEFVTADDDEPFPQFLRIRGIPLSQLYLDGEDEADEVVQLLNTPEVFYDFLESAGPTGQGMSRLLQGTWTEDRFNRYVTADEILRELSNSPGVESVL